LRAITAAGDFLMPVAKFVFEIDTRGFAWRLLLVRRSEVSWASVFVGK
jgi:hypothetical protein